MTRILIATVPVIGHVAPFLPLAEALVKRGHDVRWYTGEKYRARVEKTGARFAGARHARDYDDADFERHFPKRAELEGIAKLKFDMKHVFIDNAEGQTLDLERITKELPADVIVGDPTMFGGLFHAERAKTPFGILGVLPLASTSVDAAPFGLGIEPMGGALGRTRNRLLHAAVQHLLFRDVQVHWNATRQKLGLPATGWWMDAAERADFYLMQTVPSFEYTRRDLPKNVHFIGMMPAAAPPAWTPPSFWPELDGTLPIVHVTQGTVANTAPDLIAPALEGLARENVLVVVSTGGRAVESLGLRNVPGNARIGTFLSYPELLPKTSVMVTNGGYGGVQTALSSGVPLVVAGVTEDKPEVAARVSWSGAGINLKTAKPTPEAVRDAVRRILSTTTYRDRARALADEYARHDALRRGVDLIERAAGVPAPTSRRPRASRDSAPSWA